MSEIDIIRIVTTVIALIVAIVGHEIMHGYVAYKYGDNTAKDEGRLNINPIRHVDPVGTIAVPALLFVAGAPFLFGWAKPVPVNIVTVVRNGGYFGAVGVALAGVTYNFTLAVLASIVLGSYAEPSTLSQAFVYSLLAQLVIINVVLGVFNLWPVPPLDGSNALKYVAMHFNMRSIVNVMQKLEPYGMIVIIVILVTPLKNIFFAPAIYLLQSLLS
ncbi:MAG: site-2 protease family protein [Campylobacterota bacterium]